MRLAATRPLGCAVPVPPVDGGRAPLQMVCSTQRADQPCAQAEAMARHVRSQGGRAEVLPQPLSHGEINARLGLDSDYTRAVETFMGSLDAEVARHLQ